MNNESSGIVVTAALEFLATKFESTKAEIVISISEGNESLKISFLKLVDIATKQIDAGMEIKMPEEVPLGLTDLQMNQECYVNMYKDRYGIRPRHLTSDQFNSVEWLDAAIEELRKTPID